MIASQVTWIAVADAARASFFEFTDMDKQLEPVPEGQLSHVNLPTRELVSNQRGRVFNSADGSRSAMEPRTDAHQHEKAVFAAEISEFLASRSKNYDRMIIVAPPTMLGHIRKSLSDSIKQKIRGEINKDLTNIPENQLPKHLRSFLPIG